MIRKAFHRCKIHALVLIFLAAACTAEEAESPDIDTESPSQFTLQLTVTDQQGNTLQPVSLFLLDPENGRNSRPVKTAVSHNGTITAQAEKNRPYLVRVNSAWHLPVYFFLQSYSDDSFTAEIRPQPVHLRTESTPAIIGNFNHYDRFSAIEMEQTDENNWQAEISFDADTLFYRVAGVHPLYSLHGTDGTLVADKNHGAGETGIESKLVRQDTGSAFTISFDPEEFKSEPVKPSIIFGDDVPVADRGVASVYALSIRQAEQVEEMLAEGKEL